MKVLQKQSQGSSTSTYNTILQSFIMPMMDLQAHTTHMKCLQFLEKSQWLRPAQLLELQNKRLKALLNYAYETVPFYRRRFRDAGIKPGDIRGVGQLAKLPRLSKEEIRKNIQEMVSTRISKSRLIPFKTGGSTGVPLKFLKDKRTTSWALAATSRSYRWADLDLGDKYLILWSSAFDMSMSQELRGFLHARLMRYQMLSSYQMSDSSMVKFVELIRRYKPKALKGYTSSLVLFAHYLKLHGKVDLNLRSVISTAETLFPADRKLMEEQFGCDVYDTYGSREIAMMAGECQEHQGLHVSSETVALEFVKENENVAAGEIGEILATDLQNYGMPLIRYEIGDAGRPSDALCTCGRGLPLIESVDGRVTDFIRTNDGRTIPGCILTYLLSDLPVQKYQFVQTELNSVTVKIVKDNGYSSGDDEKIASRIKQKIGPEFGVTVEHVDSIPSSSRSGKFLAVISNIPAFGPSDISFIRSNTNDENYRR
jgi:phenylacetate-CoA ligase